MYIEAVKKKEDRPINHLIDLACPSSVSLQSAIHLG